MYIATPTLLEDERNMSPKSRSPVGLASLLISFLLSTSVAQPDLNTVRYDSLEVFSEIVERFATTRVTSLVSNLANEPKEIVFAFQLPKEGAFISKLTM